MGFARQEPFRLPISPVASFTGKGGWASLLRILAVARVGYRALVLALGCRAEAAILAGAGAVWYPNGIHIT